MARPRDIALVPAFGLLLSACAPDPIPAAKVDQLAVLPKGAPAKAEFVRHYLHKPIRSDEEAPFWTTARNFRLDRRHDLWLAVFVLPSSPDVLPGVRVAASEAEMPRVMRGGCDVVNLAADARTGETLSSWCNLEDLANPLRPIPPLTPNPLYDSPASPFAG